MRMRRVLRIGAIAAWGLALAPVVPSTFGTAPGATLDAQGWWNKTQALPVQGSPTGVDDPTGLGLTTAPTVPAPATVPAEGLYVANDASGPSAVAAVRYLLEGQAGGTLTLQLADGAALTGTEAVVACPIQGGFTPAQNGRWDSMPGYDPAACIIPGEPSAAGDALTFAVPATFASVLGDVSIIVVPEPGSTTPFSLAFDKPTNEGFVVTTEVVSAPSSSYTAPSSSYTPGSAVFTAPGSSSFATPPAPAVSAPSSGDEEAVAPSVPVAATPAAAVADESQAAQIAAVVTMLVIGAALWWLSSQPQRAPRLLGSVGGKAAAPVVEAQVTGPVRTRGVGRFTRPRSQPATPL